MDRQRRAVRVAHWIIELEAPIDVTALLRVSDENDNATINAVQAVRVLEGCPDDGPAMPAVPAQARVVF